MSSATFRIFDQMLEGVQVIDRDCRYLYLNDAAVVQSKKKSRGELIGKSMAECYPGIEQTPLYESINTCLLSKISQDWVNEFAFPDGSKGFFQLRIISIDQGALIMSFDVTSQKKAEAIIRDNNEYLELMVSTRTAELQAQQVIIENQLRFVSGINETRDRLFGIVAHDLVAPLHSVKGLIGMLLMDTTALNQEEVVHTIEQLQSSIQNTIVLAEKLVLWARTQISTHSQPHFEKVNVFEVVDEVVKLYGGLSEKKGITLMNDVPNKLHADADKHQLSFIIRNLVNNAIKFTGNKGHIQIEAHESDFKVIISVSDNGIGMPKSIIDKIQTARIDKSVAGTIGEKGTGLGLLLCYEFMAQNDGQLDIESTEGIGSTFRVVLNSFR